MGVLKMDRIDKLQKRYQREPTLKDKKVIGKTIYLKPETLDQLEQIYLKTKLDLYKKKQIGKIEFIEAILKVGLKEIEKVKETLLEK